MKKLNSVSNGTLALCLPLFFGHAATALGQTVFSVPGPVVAAKPAPPNSGPGSAKSTSLSSLNSAFSSLAPLTQWGSVAIRPYFSYQLAYGNGILRVPGEPTNTTQQTISIGTAVELGKHWVANYSLQRTLYESRLIADYSTHALSLAGSATRGDLNLGISAGYNSSAPTRVETGQQTPEKTYTLGGNAGYQVGARTLLSATVSRSHRDVDLVQDPALGPVPDVEQWNGSGTLRYRFTPRFDMSVGIRLGYDRFSNSPDMNVSEPQLTISWQPTDRVSMTAQGGIETRNFQQDDTENLDSEVYNGSASYQATQYTTLTLSGDRRVAPSYFARQLTRTTGWGLSLQQRFLRRYYLNGGFSHGKTTYVFISQGFAEGRSDSFDSYNVGLSTAVLRRASVSVNYQESKNSSNIDVYNFSSHQVSFSFAYRF